MHSDTILYIEVPFEKIMMKYPNSTELYLEKKHWHEHINFFSEESLHKLTNECSLEIIKTKVHNNLLEKNIINIDSMIMLACKKT